MILQSFLRNISFSIYYTKACTCGEAANNNAVAGMRQRIYTENVAENPADPVWIIRGFSLHRVARPYALV